MKKRIIYSIVTAIFVSLISESMAEMRGLDEAEKRVIESTVKSQETLESVKQRIPEEAESALNKSIEHSKTGRKHAIESLNRDRSSSKNIQGSSRGSSNAGRKRSR